MYGTSLAVCSYRIEVVHSLIDATIRWPRHNRMTDTRTLRHAQYSHKRNCLCIIYISAPSNENNEEIKLFDCIVHLRRCTRAHASIFCNFLSFAQKQCAINVQAPMASIYVLHCIRQLSSMCDTQRIHIFSIDKHIGTGWRWIEANISMDHQLEHSFNFNELARKLQYCARL